jgi:hypothetical protein
VEVYAKMSLAISAANRWGLAMALYMIGFISYGATLVFYAAVFPRLARNTQHSRDLREKYDHGEISTEVYEREESLEKNRISNISTVGALLATLLWMTYSCRLTVISVISLHWLSIYRSSFPFEIVRKSTIMFSSCEA